MSSVSALNKARFEGIATVEELGLRGMITIRGDLGATALKNAATGVAGVDFPAQGACNCVGERGIAWMSPDEILVMTPYAEAEKDAGIIAQALAGQHALVANVSDARAVFYITGKYAREVIAKLAPVDLSPAHFPTGQFRRTRLAQVPAAFWMRDEETVELICFRSVAQYVFDLLVNAARTETTVDFL